VSHANVGKVFRHIHIRDEDNWWMTHQFGKDWPRRSFSGISRNVIN